MTGGATASSWKPLNSVWLAEIITSDTPPKRVVWVSEGEARSYVARRLPAAPGTWRYGLVMPAQVVTTRNAGRPRQHYVPDRAVRNQAYLDSRGRVMWKRTGHNQAH